MTLINDRGAGATGAIVSKEEASIIARGLDVLRKQELLAMKEAEEAFDVVSEARREYSNAQDDYIRGLSSGDSAKSEVVNMLLSGVPIDAVRVRLANERANAVVRAAEGSYCSALTRILERVSAAAAKLPACEVRVVSEESCDKMESIRRATSQVLETIRVSLGEVEQTPTPPTAATAAPAPAASGWGNLFRPRPGEWRCGTCLSPNPREETACMACEAPRG